MVDRALRAEARTEIVTAASKYRRTRASRDLRFAPKPFTMRQLQRAVCVVRRQRLVSSGVLIAAGFRP
jgi:hypothetical protein